ncbi:MAM and LDL-receptor class A domain-containing protein 1-like [Mizuhopecten yessoensis]|uniref:MAM and LDL-receptor class A domain-containing protein 1-like n=1 Tax=Mizuhopecten yessoensis TaxID=6573 RepID=UPI000B457D7D|nr:MAM and LDL-receptor class A domain-containing protein 1-like [Mizuhopecten yessoensis]
MEISTLQCVILIISVIQVFSLQTLYLDEACASSKLTYVETAARIKASRYSTLNRNLNCSVIVRARPEDQLVAVVRSMNSNCKYVMVTAYDGENRNRKIEDMCGFSEFNLAKRTFTSSRNALVFNLVTASSLTTSKYDIIVTSYSTGLCTFGMECDNGRCIDSSLHCNGYNNCGDNSDEFLCSSTVVVGAGIIVAIVLGGLFVVVCLPVIIVVMIFRRRRAYSKF